ncbi:MULTISPECIES: MOSC domain-containing protein [unclassified Streptomyces]|uniref:MOSC domain-containing protein n=1 Tax=unclassified Streptomyces TaxID=2593676 RepID=UPI00278BB77E|nr:MULTISPECIES: MOSC N-terminal beta barrel domain-containing protein [unclassified Streptomyces]
MTPSSTPRVTSLTTTAVKGLGIVRRDEVELTRTGVVGDRAFFMVDADGKLISMTRTGAWAGHTAHYDAESAALTVHCPDGTAVTGEVRLTDTLEVDFFGHHKVPCHVVEGPWAELFSERAGQPVRLVHPDAENGGVDLRPVTLLGDASVAELARNSGLDTVDERRFRMTLGFSGTEPHAEDTWEGRTLRVGEAVLRVEGPVKRCGAVNRDPVDGSGGVRALSLIKGYRGLGQAALGRGVLFGVYADVLTPGRIRVGDTLEPVAAPS